MNILKCEYNMDYDTLDIHFSDGSTLGLICETIESGLNAQTAARSKLRWLLDNEPETYAELYLKGEMQDYCDLIDRSHDSQYSTIQKQLEEHFDGDKAYADAIAREIMMYNY